MTNSAPPGRAASSVGDGQGLLGGAGISKTSSMVVPLGVHEATPCVDESDFRFGGMRELACHETDLGAFSNVGALA